MKKKKRNIYRRLFMNFLSRQNLRDEFMNNFKKYYDYGWTISQYMNITNPSSYITAAFIFPTEEIDKWLNVSSQWRDLVILTSKLKDNDKLSS